MNTTLALTISPPNKIGKGVTVKSQFIDDYDNIKSIFRYNRIKRYIVYPEFDNKGRLHYHGVCTLDHNQKVRFYKHAQVRLRNIGFLDIKPLETFKDRLRWIIYMKKEWGTTQEILDIKVPLMHFCTRCIECTSKLDITKVSNWIDPLDYGLTECSPEHIPEETQKICTHVQT